MAKKNKKRKDEPLRVSGSFFDIIKASVKGNPKPKKRTNKKGRK